MSRTPRLLAAFTMLVAGSLVATGAHPQSSTSSAPPRGTSSATPDVDLLHAVPTTVIVNACDTSACDPAAVIDNDPGTAWGARGTKSAIVVRLPANVRITGVRVTLGAAGPAFEANPRTRVLRIALGAQTVGDFRLNPAQRGPQWVPLNLQGGDLKLVFDCLAWTTQVPHPINFVAQLEVRGTTPSPSATTPRFEVGARASGNPAAIGRLTRTLRNTLAAQPPRQPNPCPCEGEGDGDDIYHVADPTACQTLQDTVHEFLVSRAALARETCGSNPFAADGWVEYDRLALQYLHPVRAAGDDRDEAVIRDEILGQMGDPLAGVIEFCAGHPAILDTRDNYCTAQHPGI